MRTRSAVEIAAYNNGLEAAAHSVVRTDEAASIRAMKIKPKHPEDRGSGFLDPEMIDEILRHLHGVLPGSNRETARAILEREFLHAQRP